MFQSKSSSLRNSTSKGNGTFRQSNVPKQYQLNLAEPGIKSVGVLRGASASAAPVVAVNKARFDNRSSKKEIENTKSSENLTYFLDFRDALKIVAGTESSSNFESLKPESKPVPSHSRPLHRLLPLIIQACIDMNYGKDNVLYDNTSKTLKFSTPANGRIVPERRELFGMLMDDLHKIENGQFPIHSEWFEAYGTKMTPSKAKSILSILERISRLIQFTKENNTWLGKGCDHIRSIMNALLIKNLINPKTYNKQKYFSFFYHLNEQTYDDYQGRAIRGESKPKPLVNATLPVLLPFPNSFVRDVLVAGRVEVEAARRDLMNQTQLASQTAVTSQVPINNVDSMNNINNITNAATPIRNNDFANVNMDNILSDGFINYSSINPLTLTLSLANVAMTQALPAAVPYAASSIGDLFRGIRYVFASSQQALNSIYSSASSYFSPFESSTYNFRKLDLNTDSLTIQQEGQDFNFDSFNNASHDFSLLNRNYSESPFDSRRISASGFTDTDMSSPVPRPMPSPLVKPGQLTSSSSRTIRLPRASTSPQSSIATTPASSITLTPDTLPRSIRINLGAGNDIILDSNTFLAKFLSSSPNNRNRASPASTTIVTPAAGDLITMTRANLQTQAARTPTTIIQEREEEEEDTGAGVSPPNRSIVRSINFEDMGEGEPQQAHNNEMQMNLATFTELASSSVSPPQPMIIRAIQAHERVHADVRQTPSTRNGAGMEASNLRRTFDEYSETAHDPSKFTTAEIMRRNEAYRLAQVRSNRFIAGNNAYTASERDRGIRFINPR